MDRFVHLPDDFPPRRNNDPREGGGGADLTDWGRLIMGKTIGKSANIRYTNSGGLNQRSTVNMLELRGEDHNAIQLSLLVSPPMVTPNGTTIPNNVLNLGGPFQDYSQELGGVWSGLALPGVIVEWGIGGVLNKVEADVSTGLQLNLGGASFLRVSAYVEEPFQRNTRDAVYNLSAFVNPGRCKDIGATRTVQVGDVNAGATSSVFAIPRFARRVTMTSAGDFVGNVVMYGDGAGAEVVSNTLFAFNSANGIYAPVPNGAYFFAVVGGGNCDNVSVIFDLAL